MLTTLSARSCAAAGVVCFVGAVAMHPAAEAHLWAHMTQHLLLVVVASPLLAVPLVQWRPPHPSVAVVATWTVLHSVALWGWHLPGPFDAALRSEPLHGIEHLCLFVTAVGFWWAAIGTVGQGVPGVGVAAVFVTAMQGIALGGLMTLASHSWYAGYRLTDQQVAGVIMWCPAGFVYTAVVAAMLYRWLAERDRVAT
ncbi:MAG: putative rane protein [Actinomycetota bacterium]|nr:putative rane protein [Actinomycetota bacterium]